MPSRPAADDPASSLLMDTIPPRRTAHTRLLGDLGEMQVWGVVLILPCLVIVASVILYPALFGLGLSLGDLRPTRPGSGADFVGLMHYRDLAANPVFWLGLRNTLIFASTAVGAELCLGLVTALALDRGLPGCRAIGVLIIVPFVLPSIVSANMWALLLDPHAGPVNGILLRLGLVAAPHAFFADARTALPAAILVEVWHGFPFFTVIILAALRQVPRSLLEAAGLDGAGPGARFVHVALPSLRTIIAAAVVVRAIGVINAPDLLLILTHGGPGRATETLALQAFQRAYGAFDFGASAAIGVVMMALLALLAGALIRLRQGETG